jgi:transposase-like protein
MATPWWSATGKGRTRRVTIGSGTIAVDAPCVNDRRVDADGQRRKFTSHILPPYMRRSRKVAEVLPVLYLRGLSTGDFREALAALLGKDAAGLSATNIARLTNEWEAEYRAFQKRSLADRDYVYAWVDGVHFNVRLEDDRLCTLVMIGVLPNGTKELIAVEDGYRESAESWKTVLRDLKRRGMRAPVVAVGDGALGFWAAVRDVWPKTRPQRDWVHKLGNILDKLPRRLQPRVRAALHEVMYPRPASRRERRSPGSPTNTAPSTRRPSRRWSRMPTRC